MSALWKAMLEAQKEIKHAVKDAKNPHFKNDYATLQSTLDAVKPALNRNGLVLTQEIRHGNQPEGTVRVTTRIVHAASGEQTADAQVIPLVKNDPQGLGSAVTYARRYAIQAMLGIAAEDDDGEPAVGPRTAPQRATGTGNTSGTIPVRIGQSNERVVEGEVVKKETMATPQQIDDVKARLEKSLGFKTSK